MRKETIKMALSMLVDEVFEDARQRVRLRVDAPTAAVRLTWGADDRARAGDTALPRRTGIAASAAVSRKAAHVAASPSASAEMGPGLLPYMNSSIVPSGLGSTTTVEKSSLGF